MTDDLQNQLRSAADDYPAPTMKATERARRAFLNAVSKSPAGPRRTGYGRIAAAAAAFIVCVAAAFGTGFAVASSDNAAISTTTSTATSATGGLESASGPGFLPASGWNIAQTTATVPSDPQSAIATNGQIDPEDFSFGGRPSNTIGKLGPEGILIYAMFTPSGELPTLDQQYPKRTIPLRLSDAGDAGLEGLPDRVVSKRLLARVAGYNADVLIVFGRHDPPRALEAEADAELGRLVVPGCPTHAPRINPDEKAAAMVFLRAWLLAHYQGRPTDLGAVKLTAHVIGVEDASAGAAIIEACGGRVRGRLLEVDVTLPQTAQPPRKRPFVYLLNETPGSWEVWRQG